MQWRSAASKSPDWYSRCASSANPWKESIRFVGSGAPAHPGGRGGGVETMLGVMVGERKQTNENNKYDENNNKITGEQILFSLKQQLNYLNLFAMLIYIKGTCKLR